MTPLNHKLFRELWRLKGQVLAIALVIASGVATLVMSMSTIEALEETTEAYYQRYGFGEVFASVTRAPEKLSRQIAEIPGVQTIQTRIKKLAVVDIDNFEEPVLGLISSLPEQGQPLLSQLAIRKGTWITPGRTDEVIVSEPFAEAHELHIGDVFKVIMNGNKRPFRIVGIALCPEYIYSLGPGALLPDDKRFAVMWMNRKTLEAAFDLNESFNDITLSVLPNTQIEPLLNRLDILLEPYGGISSISRKDQLSNWFIMNEIAQQKTMATILPTLFIIVAVFLTNMVLSRLIATERTDIGLLKAFGYSNFQIAWHYIKMMIVISLIGILLGWIIGLLFGRYNSQMYAELFRFPLFIFRPSPHAFLVGALVSMTAALFGALFAVKNAITLPPAEAMSPPSPPMYHRSHLFTGLNLTQWIDQATRIALRQIGRWPIRSLLTSAGIGLSVGLSIMTLQWKDSLNHIAIVNFYEAQRQDIMVGVSNTQPIRAIHDFLKLPGVLSAEPVRYAGADFFVGTRSHRGAISGIQPNNLLQPVYDDEMRTTVSVPENGLIISKKLATKLGVRIGDSIWVEILDGKRPQLYIPVVNIVNTFIGMPVYLNISALNKILQEVPSLEYVNLLVDSNDLSTLFKSLKNTPMISSVMLKQAAIDSFYQTLVKHLMTIVFMFTVLATILAFGVAYNSTRIALSERGRELATLRVLGFTKTEISYVLLGEVMLLVVIGLPLGCFMGWGLVWTVSSAFDTELFRIPLVIERSTYGTAVLIVLAAAITSAALVRRRVNKLDLIKVLKTRE
jgi:putative ABC transport system permease protein